MMGRAMSARKTTAALVDVLKAVRLEPSSAWEVMEITGMGETMVRDILGVLTEHGVCDLTLRGGGPGRPRKLYCLAPAWGGPPQPEKD